MELNYDVITHPDDVPEVMQSLENNPFFALDLETTGFDFDRHLIHGLALATEDMAWYVTLGAEKAIIPHIMDIMQKKPVVGHNLKFDLHFLLKYGPAPRVCYDTMLGQFLIDENQGLGLKDLAVTKLGLREELPDFGSLLRKFKPVLGKRILGDMNVYDLPINDLAEYAARDARLTYDLWKKTSYELAQEEFWEHFINVEMPFMYILLDMEHRGFWIDQPLLHQMELDYTEMREKYLTMFSRISNDVNPNSPKQLSEFFYGKLGYAPTRFTKKSKGQNPAVDNLALIRMEHEDHTGAVRALREFRSYDKLLNTYILPFQEKLFDGRLKGRFNQTGAVTGRLSSSDPNLQNIPAKEDGSGGKVRDLFAAPPGYKFMACDYSQLELRILAHYSQDERLMEVFNTGGDPHQMTADLVGCTRKDAKTVNFARIYGVGPNGMSDQIEEATGTRPSVKDVKNWLRAYDEQYPKVPVIIERVLRKARQTGFVRTLGGRKRRIPEINDVDDGIRARAERQTFNSLIQGSASDIIKKAMIDIYNVQDNYGSRMLGQVHDEVNFESHEKHVEEFAQYVQQTMEGAGDYFGLRVHLKAEPKIGNNWSECK